MIILPECSDDEVSNALRDLTKRIAKKNPELKAGGLLGGEYGYGCAYEDEIFIMHPFCWCEKTSCPWCIYCDCHENEGCDWCRGLNKHADKGALSPDDPPHAAAPNFWHKKSGLRIWWYKYIGRDMVIYTPNENSKKINIPKIIKECYR